MAIVAFGQKHQSTRFDFSNSISDITTDPYKKPEKYRHGYKGPFRRMFRTGDLKMDPNDKIDPGKPLFLTPLLEAGKVEVSTFVFLFKFFIFFSKPKSGLKK